MFLPSRKLISAKEQKNFTELNKYMPHGISQENGPCDELIISLSQSISRIYQMSACTSKGLITLPLLSSGPGFGLASGPRTKLFFFFFLAVLDFLVTQGRIFTCIFVFFPFVIFWNSHLIFQKKLQKEAIDFQKNLINCNLNFKLC